MLAIALLALPAVIAPWAGASARLDVPRGFVRHTSEPYWAWYAPKSWLDSYGANGILISSPTGTLFNDYGQGATPCPPSVTGYFDAISANARKQKALYSLPLASVHYTSIGKVSQPTYGDFHRRYTWKGRRPNGTQVQGELILEIFAVDAANGVCGQRSQNRGAPSRGFADSLRTLRAVQSLIFYNSQPVTRQTR